MTEDALRKLARRWEDRVPDLYGEWTHWWIEGDGGFLAVIPGEDLAGVVQVVRENWERFESIYVHRARVDSLGAPSRQDHRVEVANRLSNSRCAT